LTEEIQNIYQHERGRLLAFINKRVENREDAEDILQDIFCKTIESVSVIQSIENVVGWLYTSARNKIIDWYRKKKPYSISFQDEDSQAGLDTILAGLKFNPEHAFYRNLLIEEITESLEELPEEQKTVFIWNVLEGRTFKELSKITGESINTLLSRKRYAVHFLRNRLKDINEIINQMT
jgi:RNA polymerase sigma factor (sigma-70 family)